MNKLLNNILVCTTIMCCCNVKASVSTEYFNMLEFSKEVLDTCSIDTSSTSDINCSTTGSSPHPPHFW